MGWSVIDGGGGGGGAPTEIVDTFTALASQTIFNLSGLPSDVTDVEVHVNGVEYNFGINYTVVGAVATWLDVPFVLSAGDIIVFRYFV
jgi:hypothetical protein